MRTWWYGSPTAKAEDALVHLRATSTESIRPRAGALIRRHRRHAVPGRQWHGIARVANAQRCLRMEAEEARRGREVELLERHCHVDESCLKVDLALDPSPRRCTRGVA